MCNISFCDVDSKVDQFFQPTLYIIVIILGLPTNCMALWAAYMQVRLMQTLGAYISILSLQTARMKLLFVIQIQGTPGAYIHLMQPTVLWLCMNYNLS